MLTYIKYGTLASFILSAVFLAFSFTIENKTSGEIEENETEVVAVNDKVIAHFIDLATKSDEAVTKKALAFVDKNWDATYEIMLVESIYFSQSRSVSGKLLRLLERKTGKQFGYDFDKWFNWIWNKKPTYEQEYFEFKARLHQFIDPKFHHYFSERAEQSTIRLDEVRWGGVLQDGIPPLRDPKMIGAEDASYLNDTDIVFGIEVNGDARAYPKRILAWHEMFTDTVGSEPVAGVYCTLCGTVILYQTSHQGTHYQLGTSGFLYRSNKLMYDKKTQSLWSTLEGEPVIGPLVGKGIQLNYLSVVTTSWGEWKKRHPQTTVLSLDTGHRRDYGEGVAYKEYFATDELMFGVPETDGRLKNKDEILAIRIPERTTENLAISSRFLRKNNIYSGQIGPVKFTVFTDRSGGHRVYETKEVTFDQYDGQSNAIDSKGRNWTLNENDLVSKTTQSLDRIPTHNAFWFGYKAAFPEVRLIK